MKTLKLLIVFFISQVNFAQVECNCPSFSNDKEGLLLEDSTLLFQTIKQLIKSKNEQCHFKAVELRFQFYCNHKKVEKTLFELDKMKSLEKSLTCISPFVLYYSEARYFHIKNDYPNLSKFAFKALKVAEKEKDLGSQILALKEIVHAYNRMNEDELVWKYVLKCEKLMNIPSQKNSENLIWLAFSYETRFTIKEDAGYLEKIKLYGESVKKKSLAEGNYLLAMNSYRILESYAYHKGDMAKALSYIDSAVFYSKRIKGYLNPSGLYRSKAWDHFDLGQTNEALKWMDSSIYYSKLYEKHGAGLMMAYLDASELFELCGRTGKALDAQKIYISMKDSILQLDRITAVKELDTKYKTELKDAEIEQLNQQKKINNLEIENKRAQLFWILGISAIVLLLALIIVFIYRQRAANQKIKTFESEQRLNRARMDPHFFFNALSSIQTMALKEDSPNTALVLAKFTKVMRQSLESTYLELNTIEDEFSFLKQYLELQKLRYGEKFEYSFNVSDEVEVDEIQIPSMILQPFIENSIEHGFKGMETGGQINISVQKIADTLEIVVIDNGIENKELNEPKAHKSRASEIIKDRLYLLKKQTGKNTFFETEANLNQQGYKVKLILPLIYKEI